MMMRLWRAGVAAAALIAAGEASAADLALRRVLLSTGGVGLYEYEADVDGDATVELKAPFDQIDDILKSLVVFDEHGGVGGLDLAGPKPLAEAFRALPFTLEDLQSTPQLLSALRGAEVEIAGPRAVKGRIVAVMEEHEVNGAAQTTRHRLTVMTDAGLEQCVLEQADSVRFADPGLRTEIGRALSAVAADAMRDSRTLRLSSKGEGKRKLHVAYLAAAPVWKVAYRLVLDAAPDAKSGALQGWATLENFSGQDWNGVDLTLVSGRPVSYRQALYRAYMVERPEAPLDIGPALDPAVDNGAIAAPMAAPAPPARFMAKARAIQLDEPALSGAAETATRQEGETQVAFHLAHPVSVANGRTLSLPIVDADAPVARVAVYDRNVDSHHPLSAAELRNDGSTALPPGIVTIYERGAGGVTYVGDSRLGALPAGETRLLSYALDQKTAIAEDDSDRSVVARSRVAKGVLTLDDLTRRRSVYRVKADAPRRLIVFAPKLEGGKLTEPDAKGVTEADGRYRVTFEAKAGDGQSFAVAQERRQARLVALASLDDAALAVYAKSGELDADARDALAKLGGLRAAQAEADRIVDEAHTEVAATQADQTRLKDLLGAVAAGSDLAKRYLGKLDADETELETQRAELIAKTRARDAARDAVEAFAAGG